jgi:hypothetical protein
MSKAILVRGGTNDSDWWDLPDDLRIAIQELHAVYEAGALHPKQRKAVRTVTEYIVKQHKAELLHAQASNISPERVQKVEEIEHDDQSRNLRAATDPMPMVDGFINDPARIALEKKLQHEWRERQPHDVVERAAVALCPWYVMGKSESQPFEVWEAMPEMIKEFHRAQAKAAIAAMQEGK